MNDDPIQPNDQFSQDLREIYHADVRVSVQIDDAILNRARAHFARPRGSRGLVLRIGALATAAAAVIVFAIFIAKPRPPKNIAQVVDITDALRVARDIQTGRADVARDDFNHDGAVDQLDVDAIAMSAVQLEKVQ